MKNPTKQLVNLALLF